jgi:hypothetical protein
LVYAQTPLCEQFEENTFPPTGWTLSGTGYQYWLKSNQGGFGVGHSAEYDMWNAPAGTSSGMTTAVFTSTGLMDSLIFDISYTPFPSVPPYAPDSLFIMASSNGGSTYVIAKKLGPLDMMTCNPASGNCNPLVWAKRTYWLPTGTNKIQLFCKSGFGNDVYLDSICILNGTLGITPINSIAANYSLEQNYPNPFNPSTNIKFSIPKPGFVNLVITDALGRNVKTLVSEFKSAGSYNVDFDASLLASGIYFYTISSADWTETKKMLLIK